MWKNLKLYFKYTLFGKLRVERFTDTPFDLDDNTMYLIDEWSIVFKCPCGCEKDIHLNTLKNASPKWSYSIKKNRIDITPSIRRLKGCKSHFWIKKGKVVWC